MMLDRDIVAVSPSSTYRVRLHSAIGYVTPADKLAPPSGRNRCARAGDSSLQAGFKYPQTVRNVGGHTLTRDSKSPA